MQKRSLARRFAVLGIVLAAALAGCQATTTRSANTGSTPGVTADPGGGGGGGAGGGGGGGGAY
jgi:Spy/CpxP family protein refolding chaperone